MPRKQNAASQSEQPLAKLEVPATVLEDATLDVALAKAEADKSLAGFNLTGLDFSGCDLRTVDFTGSDLTGCTFRESVLQGCNFTNATFDPDQFNDADTRWAIWG